MSLFYMEELEKMIMEDEGFSAIIYKCPTGYLTARYGHNFENPMSQKMARIILTEDLYGAIKEVNSIFHLFFRYSKDRKLALINMCFNLGLPRFRAFRRMIAAIQLEDWVKAAAEMKDSAWYKQVGNRSKRLHKLIKNG